MRLRACDGVRAASLGLCGCSSGARMGAKSAHPASARQSNALLLKPRVCERAPSCARTQLGAGWI